MARIERIEFIIGREAEQIEAIWRELEFAHATTIGAISEPALAGIDTALWELRCRRRAAPLDRPGGAADHRTLYTTEGGWLHIDEQTLVHDAIAVREQGFMGSKIKIDRPCAGGATGDWPPRPRRWAPTMKS
jgi:L-alanine-DL-glutamate epimerase-like enolase superfamily enzyme